MGTEAGVWLDDMADTRPCLTAESNDSCMVLATVQRELSYDSTRTNFPASTTPVPYQLEATFTARVTIDDIFSSSLASVPLSDSNIDVEDRER